jgi:predicted  nucleic acid-binding Zn-ribbon protein
MTAKDNARRAAAAIAATTAQRAQRALDDTVNQLVDDMAEVRARLDRLEGRSGQSPEEITQPDPRTK